MASGRVYPGTSGEIDMGISAVSYRGGAVSRISEDDIETQKNMMSFEDARWIGVRKKVPGMSGVPTKPAKPRTLGTFTEFNEVDRYAQDLENLKTYVRQHFHQKECTRFVPKAQKPPEKAKELKCHCGEVLAEHANLHVLQDLVPNEYKFMLSPEGANARPPVNIPKLPWEPANIISQPTMSFGKINFVNVEHAGGKKPAKYIRMSTDDSVDNLINLMMDHWKIMKPEKPNLVISVVGGAKNFKLDGRMRETFSIGLIKAAKTTSAWLITSGFNMGIMKGVGQAVRQGQSFCWDKDRMAHVLRCIGIAPWGYVKDRRDLVGKSAHGMFSASYRTSNVILHNSAVPLNPDHTHFIFVDDGYRIRYEGVAEVRSKLEQKISQPEEERGLGIPVVLVVVEGGVDCIRDAKSSLQHKIPVVVCAGTGRAADILAYAYKHTKTEGNQVVMKEKHEAKIVSKIIDAYGKNWSQEEKQTKANAIKDSVKFCCENSNLMVVFNMSKHEDLDLAILSCLLKAKSGADEAQRLSQLKLALMWDRGDIAQEEIFREDVLWSREKLYEILTDALLSDKVRFVELILQQGIVMKEYLTPETLEMLYGKVPSTSYIFKILRRWTGNVELNLGSVQQLLVRLLDKHDAREELFEYVLDDTSDEKKTYFKRPHKMLLIWAILQKRQTLAKLFWELGDEPITSALSASRIYHALGKNLAIHETQLKEKLEEYENEFEELATKVLDESHHNDQEKAMMLLERRSPCWNQLTCLQIAASAKDRTFLSAPSCQDSMNFTWGHGITFPWYKLLLCIIFPPYIVMALDEQKVGAQKLTSWQKIALFYSSPLSKFVHEMVLYMLFLILHSYMVLVDFDPDRVKPLEVVVVLWIFTFFVDELHTFIVFPAPTLKSKLRDWYDVLKWLDIFNFALVFVGFLLHLIWGHNAYEVTKVIYCINSVVFFLRIIQFYVYHGQLGPKVFMIQKMLNELRLFILVLLLFLLAYGVSSQGLLYHQRRPSWTILKDVFYYPYWQLYGEIFLEDIKTEESCMAGSVDCRTYHPLVELLLAAYLLVGNILLLNLLIAIFSQVFQTVNQNAKQIWKFQMYFLVMEYEVKTAIVPPFSIFQHIFLVVRWILRKTCMKKRKKGQTFGKRHLDYLQLFEKEMMMNVLRKMKAEAMGSLETTVSKLQKRMDDLTKLIEDEVIADQQPPHVLVGMEGMVDGTTPVDGQSTKWPPVQRVISLGLREAMMSQVIASERNTSTRKLKAVEEEKAEKKEEKERPETAGEGDGEKRHKRKHKKHKKAEEKTGLMDEEAKDDPARSVEQQPPVEQPTPLFERKINNVNFGFNIGPDEKPEPKHKMIYPGDEGPAVAEGKEPAKTSTYYYQDESGTDNGQPTPMFTRKKYDIAQVHDRVWNGHQMKKVMRREYSEDDMYAQKVSSSRQRVLSKFESDISESDEGPTRSPRLSFQQRNKKKKKKRSRSRYDSDSD